LRRAKKKQAAGRPVPRIENCEFCGQSIDLNSYGWLVNGNGHLLCGHECFDRFWKRSERILKGEATWEDIQI